MSSEKEAMTAVAELLEVIGKHFFASDGLAKDIPFVGTFLAGINFLQDYRNKKFAKRITTFLTNFSIEDFNKFKKAIANKSNEDLGEEILSVIESLEKEVQVNMVARATKMHIALLEEGHSPNSIKYILDYNIHIIKQLDSHLLRGLHAIYSGQNSGRIGSVDQTLFNLGLLKQDEQPSLAGATVHPLPSFTSSEQGRSFYNNIVCGE